MRLKKQLGHKPEKREIESCIAHEIYLIKHNLVEEKRGRPRHEEEFLDIVTEKVKKGQKERDKREVDLALQEQVDKEFREETSGVDLRFWKPEGELTTEEKMKELSKEINENLEAQSWKGICPRCRSSVCRCQEEE